MPQAGAAPATAVEGDRPRLADGVDLIGEYEDSGFKEPPSLVRRPDGQVVQLSPMLYTIARAADGSRNLGQLAEEASRDTGRPVTPSNVGFLVDRKLRPLGILAGADGRSPELRRNDPMTALRFRAALVPEGVVNAITTVFRPLFLPAVVVAVLAALVGADAYVFFLHGLAQGVRSLLSQPVWFMGLFGLVVASAAFHECGHATACRYGGARPGVMGAGLYIVWPAFYTDVTDAYRLGKGGRLRTDLGGIYFNMIFSLGTFAAYLATRAEPLLVIVALQHLEMAHQFLPSLRLDGYYVVADLTGVPDLFGRIKPVLRSLLPGRSDPRVTELKRWVRVVVTGWVLVTIPVIAVLYGLLLINIPRMVATGVQSARHLGSSAGGEYARGNALQGTFDWVQVALLVLPMIGLVLTFGSAAKGYAAKAWKATDGRPVARAGLVALSVVAVAVAALVLGPRANYTPIQPGERGTLAGAASEIGSAPSAILEGKSVGPAPVASPASSSHSAPAAGAPVPATTTGTSGSSSGSVAEPTPSAAPSASPLDSPSPVASASP